jgi:hypothetical protein
MDHVGLAKPPKTNQTRTECNSLDGGTAPPPMPPLDFSTRCFRGGRNFCRPASFYDGLGQQGRRLSGAARTGEPETSPVGAGVRRLERAAPPRSGAGAPRSQSQRPTQTGGLRCAANPA